jgi:hypothetical protein
VHAWCFNLKRGGQQRFGNGGAYTGWCGGSVHMLRQQFSVQLHRTLRTNGLRVKRNGSGNVLC